MSEVRRYETLEKTEKILRKLLRHAKLGLWDMRSELADSWDRSAKISLILQNLKVGGYARLLQPKTRSMAKMLTYLGLVESLGVTFMDMALMLLIFNGKEMHTRGPYTKHVTSLAELQKIDLAYKQEFLKSHELHLFTELVNRNLRNEIAHLKFRIQEDGTIESSEGSEVDIDNVIQRFWETVQDFISIFDEIGFTDWLSQRNRKE